MSPSLAALIFTAFIGWLLYLDSKNPGGSFGLWVPTIWVLIMASKSIVYWFAGTNRIQMELDDYLEGDALDRNILIALIILAIITLIKRRTDWAELVSNNRALLAFYLYLAFSVLWSEYPFVAFKRYIRDIGNLLMIFVILSEQKPAESIRKVFVRCAYVLVPLSVLFIKYYPNIGRYYHRWTYEVMYGGVTTNKNSLGVLAMMSGLTLFWSLTGAAQAEKRSRALMLGELAVLGMCFWLVNIANSATSLSCLVLGIVTFFGCRLRWTRANLSRLTFGMYLALIVSAFFLWNPTARGLVAESVGRDATLTTRTDIWEAVMNMHTNFFVGVGYASVWLTKAGWEVSQAFHIPHAHNGYLETYLNTGIIGLVLLLAVIFTAGRNAAKHVALGTSTGPIFMAFFLSGVIYNYTEVTFNVNNIVCFCLWLIAVRYGELSASRLRETAGSSARVPVGTPLPQQRFRPRPAPTWAAPRSMSDARFR